ncbi:MAG: uroporphyrinogen decarboxylase family protein [Chloroflexota bacterium]|nr:uroporphyrinogen decarboxylase family protein [Chloroflexota bacterium]
MKSDVLAWAAGQPGGKLVSKETLNHQGLIELVTGLDVYRHTAEGFMRAYQALGIDIINRVPLENAPAPTPAGETRFLLGAPYNLAHLGVYDTAMRHTYAANCPDEIWDLDAEALRYEDLVTPVPHPCKAADIAAREDFVGDAGMYYPMLYTTLFMWPVETLGWENFMVAAALEPDRFHDHVLLPCVAKSMAIVAEMAMASDSPFIFVHDDLASATGPMFNPAWYDDYIFPHYPTIFEPARQRGKKIIFVADGNMTTFLPQLVDAGVDGLMWEAPLTPVEAVIEHFGSPGQFMIGGISTRTLAFGTPDDIKAEVNVVTSVAKDIPGFALATGGGFHSGLPMENIAAYFDARMAIGATPADWRTRGRA